MGAITVEGPSLPLNNFTYTRKQLVGSKATLVTVPADQNNIVRPETLISPSSNTALQQIKLDLNRRKQRISNMGYLDLVAMLSSDGRNS